MQFSIAQIILFCIFSYNKAESLRTLLNKLIHAEARSISEE